MRWQYKLLTLGWVSTCAAVSGLTLKVVPLGDSITVGAQSSTGDGYRRALNLLLDGNQVNFIGYRTAGIGRDPNIQAHGGFFINDIQNFINDTFSSRPNLYLIHAGTNNIAVASYLNKDCNNGAPDCQQAADQLAQLVDTATLTGACVLVAQIVPGNSPNFGGQLYYNNIAAYNRFVEKLVRARDYPGTGYKIQLVNMQRPNNGVNLNDISSDGVHPNDNGYLKMAAFWNDAINNASANGLIPAPTVTGGYATEACANPFNPSYSNNQIVASRGVANFFGGVQCSDASGTSNCNCNDEVGSFTIPRVGSCAEMSLTFTTASRWADLNGDARQESVWISQTGGVNVSLALSSPSNTGNNPQTLSNTFRELGNIVPSGVSTRRYQVRLADMNADARAEYLIVAYNGAVTQYANTGSMRTQDNAIAINWSGTGTQITSGFGYSGVGVKLVDWDGDGRADYVWVSADGSSIRVWLNKASSSNPNTITWTSQGVVGPAVPSGSKREFIVLADVNADGRADVLVVNQSDGSVTAYLNKPPASNSNTPQWQSIGTIVTPSQAGSVGGGSFLAVADFADPDADGAYDYVVTHGGTSAVQAIRNACIPNAN